MGEFKDKPRDAQWLTPYVTLGDVEKTLKAWREAFGFDVKVMGEENGRPTHVEVFHRKKPIVMGGPEGEDADARATKAPASLGVAASQTFYVYVDDVDAHYKDLARKRSVKVIAKPENRQWGDRAYTVTDPSGYTWMFASRLASPPSR